jgi:hypothetical protein
MVERYNSGVTKEPDNDQVMARYLLGIASEQEQRQLEERYFADDESFEELLIREEELIDDYLRGALSSQKRERFEQSYLASPERRRRVEFAGGLLGAAAAGARTTEPAAARPAAVSWWQAWSGLLRAPHPILQLSLAAGLLAAALVGSWLVVENLRLRHRLQQAEAERAASRQQEQALRRQIEEQRARNERLLAELGREREDRQPPEQRPAESQVSRPKFATFTLAPGLVRDPNEVRQLSIPPGAGRVRLRLELEGGSYQSYRAELGVLRGARAEEIWSQDGLKARPSEGGRVVVLSVPASLLSGGDYLLRLSGLTAAGNIEDLSEYSFQVERK